MHTTCGGRTHTHGVSILTNPIYIVAADDEQTYMGCRRKHMSCSCPTPTLVPPNNVADIMMDTMLWRHGRLDAPQASLALPLQHDCVLSCSATGKGPAHALSVLSDQCGRCDEASLSSRRRRHCGVLSMIHATMARHHSKAQLADRSCGLCFCMAHALI